MSPEAAERKRVSDLLRTKALTARWKAVGACSRCGAPDVKKFASCNECRRKKAKYSLGWYHRNKAAL